MTFFKHIIFSFLLASIAFAVAGCDAARRHQDNAYWSQATPAVKAIVNGERK